MASDDPYPAQLLYPAVAVPLPQGIPTEGPATHPDGPRHYSYDHANRSFPYSPSPAPHMSLPPQNTTELYIQAQQQHSQPPLPAPPSPNPDQPATAGGSFYPSSSGVPRLPPILQVEKQQVTTSATQLASASRRRNEAHFVCPVPGCGSTFTRRFNLRGVSPCFRFLAFDSERNRSFEITYRREALRL